MIDDEDDTILEDQADDSYDPNELYVVHGGEAGGA